MFGGGAQEVEVPKNNPRSRDKVGNGAQLSKEISLPGAVARPIDVRNSKGEVGGGGGKTVVREKESCEEEEREKSAADQAVMMPPEAPTEEIKRKE